MKDFYLRDKMNEEYPWVTSVYKHTSGYIHLSNRHISNVMRPVAEDDTVEIKVAIEDQFVTTDEYLEAIGAVTEITQILLGYVKHWGCTKRGTNVAWFSRIHGPTSQSKGRAARWRF